MTDLVKSYITYTGDGTTNYFQLSVSGVDIGYLRDTDIRGYVNGVEVGVSIDFNTPHLVYFDTAPAEGAEILVRRVMPDEKPFATFERGLNFNDRNVNNSFAQQLYIAQEIRDGFLPPWHKYQQDLDLGGHKLTNVASPEDPMDAVNLETLDVYNDNISIKDDEQDGRLDAIEGAYTSNANYLIDFVYDAVGDETTITTNYSVGYARLYINGVIQTRGRAWSVAGGVFTLAEPLEELDEVLIQLGVAYTPVVVSGEGDWIYTSTGGELMIEMGVLSQRAIVTINGVVQAPTLAFNIVDGVLLLAEPLEEGDLVYAIIQN